MNDIERLYYELGKIDKEIEIVKYDISNYDVNIMFSLRENKEHIIKKINKIKTPLYRTLKSEEG
jgi:hypothetical protein